MKKFLVPAMFGLAVALNGCGTVRSVTKAKAAPSWEKAQKTEFEAVAKSSVTPDGLEVVLPGDDLFRVGRSKLSKDGVQKVDAVAALLKKHAKDKVTVDDYSDSSGKAAGNLKLTRLRAGSIRAELVKAGIAEDRVAAVGRGEADPIAPNDTAAGRAQNRRAVLQIVSQ